MREIILIHSTATGLLIPDFGLWRLWNFDGPESPGGGTRPTGIPVSVGPVPSPGVSRIFHGVRSPEPKAGAMVGTSESEGPISFWDGADGESGIGNVARLSGVGRVRWRSRGRDQSGRGRPQSMPWRNYGAPRTSRRGLDGGSPSTTWTTGTRRAGLIPAWIRRLKNAINPPPYPPSGRARPAGIRAYAGTGSSPGDAPFSMDFFRPWRDWVCCVWPPTVRNGGLLSAVPEGTF